MLTPSNVMPAAPSPTGKTASVAPSDPRSLLTVPSKKFVTQTLAPSNAAPKGPLPAGNVPTGAPVAPSSFVTVSLILFATPRLTPSQAGPVGRVPTRNVASVVPSRASFVTVESFRFSTQMLFPPLTRPPGPWPTGNVPSIDPSLGSSWVTVSSPRLATQIPEGSASTATGWLPTDTVSSVLPSLARTRVTVFWNCEAIQSEIPSDASASLCANVRCRRMCRSGTSSQGRRRTPARSEHHRRVLIGRERDGVEEDVPADPIAEELLDLDEVRGGDGARAIGAGRVHEIDDDLAAFDQVLVEADRLAVVGDQGHVREMVALEPLSRIHARPGGIDGIRPWPERIAAVGVRAGLPGPGRDPGRDGPQTEGRQSRPSCHR